MCTNETLPMIVLIGSIDVMKLVWIHWGVNAFYKSNSSNDYYDAKVGNEWNWHEYIGETQGLTNETSPNHFMLENGQCMSLMWNNTGAKRLDKYLSSDMNTTVKTIEQIWCEYFEDQHDFPNKYDQITFEMENNDAIKLMWIHGRVTGFYK